MDINCIMCLVQTLCTSRAGAQAAYRPHVEGRLFDSLLKLRNLQAVSLMTAWPAQDEEICNMTRQHEVSMAVCTIPQPPHARLEMHLPGCADLSSQVVGASAGNTPAPQLSARRWQKPGRQEAARRLAASQCPAARQQEEQCPFLCTPTVCVRHST